MSKTAYMAAWIACILVASACSGGDCPEGTRPSDGRCVPLGEPDASRSPDGGPACADTDSPDLDFRDRNCDGIDGDVSLAVFVSPDGDDDDGNGTLAAPVRSIGQGVALAEAAGLPHVYVAAGDYPEHVHLPSGISLFGGYHPETWERATSQVTRVSGAHTEGGSLGLTIHEPHERTELQLLTIEAPPVGARDAHGRGLSAYAVHILGGPGPVVLRGNTLWAGTGANGAHGMPGSPGEPGDPGTTATFGDGGGGDSACGRPGGIGGQGGICTPQPAEQAPQPGGAGTGGGGAGGAPGANGSTPVEGGGGHPGDPGQDGASGMAAGVGVVGGDRLAPQDGHDGTGGSAGSGGGGGGGGGVRTTDCDDVRYGGSGGGGGGGGCPGTGGHGGLGAGGSFALWAVDTEVHLEATTLETEGGGAGGDGGDGGTGGSGGQGAPGGGPSMPPGTHGGPGGNGGRGGDGGSGGGGAGGPSVGVVALGGAVVHVGEDVIFEVSPGGPGGQGGRGAPAGPDGIRAEVYPPAALHGDE